MVGKIGAVSKRSPVKPAAKRVAKPGAKPVAKSAVKRVAKPGAKPAAKRAGVKRATPKAKKVNFNKLLIIIRNVANRTHKKGRMTGGGLEDAKNTILKYLIGSELTGAIIGLIKNDDTQGGAPDPLDNMLLRVAVADGIKKVGIFDDILTSMDKTQMALVQNIPTKNIGLGICKKNQINFGDIRGLIEKKFPAVEAAVAQSTSKKFEPDTKAHLEDKDTDMAQYIKERDAATSTDDDFINAELKKLSATSLDKADGSIETEYNKLIALLIAIKYDKTYEEVKIAKDEGIKKNFAMLMIAITLAKIHNIIKDMK
jgi:hypothetical protein